MYRPKHVEWTCREINSLHIVASVGHSIEDKLGLVKMCYLLKEGTFIGDYYFKFNSIIIFK